MICAATCSSRQSIAQHSSRYVCTIKRAGLGKDLLVVESLCLFYDIKDRETAGELPFRSTFTISTYHRILFSGAARGDIFRP